MMVIGYHICFGAYGFWLPNDPRRSGSSAVWAEHLQIFGPATALNDRSRSVAHLSHDCRARKSAMLSLKNPAVSLTGRQAQAIGRGFGNYITNNGLTAWACSILPDHVHLVIARHKYDCETIIEQLKGAATRELIKVNLHPLANFRKANGRLPSCWQRKGWFPYLWTPEAVRVRIKYVEDNPLKDGLPRQKWSFVVPFDL